MPVKTAKINLSDDYDGWWFTARTNAKGKTFQKLQSGQFDELLEGLSELVVEWNFVDEDGRDLALPSVAMPEVPIDLVNSMIEAYVSEVANLGPKSP